MQPSEYGHDISCPFIAQALEEFVVDTQNLLDAALVQTPRDPAEIAFWRSQRSAFVKAQDYFGRGVRLNPTPSGYTVPSASRPGALVHRLYKVGDIWICSCEARTFCWHHALIHGYERGAELEALAEDAAERRLWARLTAVRAKYVA